MLQTSVGFRGQGSRFSGGNVVVSGVYKQSHSVVEGDSWFWETASTERGEGGDAQVWAVLVEVAVGTTETRAV